MVRDYNKEICALNEQRQQASEKWGHALSRFQTDTNSIELRDAECKAWSVLEGIDKEIRAYKKMVEEQISTAVITKGNNEMQIYLQGLGGARVLKNPTGAHMEVYDESDTVFWNANRDTSLPRALNTCKVMLLRHWNDKFKAM